jgi:hypothetical protein
MKRETQRTPRKVLGETRESQENAVCQLQVETINSNPTREK